MQIVVLEVIYLFNVVRPAPCNVFSFYLSLLEREDQDELIACKMQLLQLSDFIFGHFFFYICMFYKSLPERDELQHGEAGVVRSHLD